MSTTISEKLTQEQKIDMIFKYFFSDKSAIKEEDFWNKLSNEEITELQNIEKEETVDLTSFMDQK